MVVNGSLKLRQHYTEFGLALGGNGLGRRVYGPDFLGWTKARQQGVTLRCHAGIDAVDTVLAVVGCDPTEESSRRIQFSPDGQSEDCELICMDSKREEEGTPFGPATVSRRPPPC